MEDYAAALDIKEEDLIVPTLKTDPLVKNAWDSIKTELEKPIPAFGQKEWREDRRKAIKTILTDLQTALMQAKELQKQDILKLGKALYNKAMQNVRAIIEQNKQLQKENGRLTEENDVLRKRIASMDENAITQLRDKNDAESQVREMLAIPEIKELWENIQQNKKAFLKQIDKWIEDGVAAIRDYADGKDNDFEAEQGNAVAWGITAEAFRCGLDPTDEKQRRMATAYLLEKVSWTGIASEYKRELTAARTRQLCDVMTVPKDLMANLLLAAGGKGSVGVGGGGSNGELTNWDGTKKKTGWGIG